MAGLFCHPVRGRSPSSLQDEVGIGHPCCPASRLECVERVGDGKRGRLAGAPFGVLQSNELLCHLFHHRSGIGEAHRCREGICQEASGLSDGFGTGHPVPAAQLVAIGGEWVHLQSEE